MKLTKALLASIITASIFFMNNPIIAEDSNPKTSKTMTSEEKTTLKNDQSPSKGNKGSNKKAKSSKKKTDKLTKKTYKKKRCKKASGSRIKRQKHCR